MPEGPIASAALRSAVVRANVELSGRGLALFDLGHVSAIDRTQGLVVARPAGLPLATVKDGDLVVTDLDGHVVAGGHTPAIDFATHLEIYRAWPSVGAIARVQSHFATVWAQAAHEIPCLGTAHAEFFNGPIPVTRQMTPAEISRDYERNIGRVIVERFDGEPTSMFGVIVNRDASFVWGASAEAALETATVLEEVARLAFHSALFSRSGGYLPQELLWQHYGRAHVW
jgi:L-ribulose-5-phosphate 4-epimerase